MARFFLLFICGVSTFLGAEPYFPKLSLHRLAGDELTVPSGTMELVFLGCRKSSITTLVEWYRAIQSNQLAVQSLSVVVVPVFPSYMDHCFGRQSIMAAIKTTIPERLCKHIGVLFSNADEMTSFFRLSDGKSEELNVFLLDEQGNILWKASGGPTPLALRQLAPFTQSF